MEEIEIWKPVIYRDIMPDMYEVSNLGNFRNRITGHVMTQCPSEKGYMMVIFRCLGGKSRSIKIHRIVAWMFVSGYDEIHNEVDHLDGNKANNRADNLEWVTRHENIRRGYAKGLIPILYGERNGNHSMTDDDIGIICECLLKYNGNSKKAYLEAIRRNVKNVNLSKVQHIKYKKTGKHISDCYFTKDQFPISHRIMGDDLDVICQTICEYNGNYYAIQEKLHSIGINISHPNLRRILNKETYACVSDKYFKKGEIKLNFDNKRLNDYRN